MEHKDVLILKVWIPIYKDFSSNAQRAHVNYFLFWRKHGAFFSLHPQKNWIKYMIQEWRGY